MRDKRPVPQGRLIDQQPAWSSIPHDAPAFQHRNAIHREGLDRVVADEHDAHGALRRETRDEGPQGGARCRVEHGGDLIEHEVARMHREDARERDALLLAAGKGRGGPSAKMGDLESRQGLVDARGNLTVIEPQIAWAECDLIVHECRNELVIRVLTDKAHQAPDLPALLGTGRRVEPVHEDAPARPLRGRAAGARLAEGIR